MYVHARDRVSVKLLVLAGVQFSPTMSVPPPLAYDPRLQSVPRIASYLRAVPQETASALNAMYNLDLNPFVPTEGDKLSVCVCVCVRACVCACL